MGSQKERRRLNKVDTADSQGGFTLVEIAVAVAILGIALTTLVGLHTRMLDTYISEKNRTHAALYAQYLLTLIEVETRPPEPGTESEDLLSKLEDAGYFDNESPRDLAGWRYTLNVSSENLEQIEDAFRRIDLSVSWGEQEDERFTLVYFINSQSVSQIVSGFPDANRR